MRIKQCKELSQEYKNRNTLYNELQSINTKNFHIDSNMYEQKIISLYDKEKSRSNKIISEIETSESKADYIELKMEENKILESILALKEKYVVYIQDFIKPVFLKLENLAFQKRKS